MLAGVAQVDGGVLDPEEPRFVPVSEPKQSLGELRRRLAALSVDEQRHGPEHLAAPAPREDFVLWFRRQRQVQERASEDIGTCLGWLEPQQADRVWMLECGIVKRRARLFKEDDGRLGGGPGGGPGRRHVWVLLAKLS